VNDASTVGNRYRFRQLCNQFRSPPNRLWFGGELPGQVASIDQFHCEVRLTLVFPHFVELGDIRVAQPATASASRWNRARSGGPA